MLVYKVTKIKYITTILKHFCVFRKSTNNEKRKSAKT